MRDIKTTVRHGLLRQRMTERLRQVGIDIRPYYLFREGTTFDRLSVPSLEGQYRTALLRPEETPSLAALRSWNTSEEILERLDQNNSCVVVWDHERVAGFTWVNPDEVSFRRCDLALRETEAYLYDAFVAPDYRGKGLAPYVRYESYRILHDAGFRTFFSISEYFNAPAIRFKQKLNGEIVRLYLEINLAKRRIGRWILKEYVEDLDGR